MKETVIKRIFNLTNMPIVIFGCAVFILHLFITPDFGDDLWFADTFSAYGYNPIAYSVMRYINWTSRTLIELMFMLGIGTPVIVWKLIDTAMFVTVAVLLSRILVKKENRFEGNIVIASLMLVFPFMMVNSAGWIATTIVYIWTLAFGLLSIYPLVKISEGKKIRTPEAILFSAALLIGGNQEQMCIFLLAIYTAFAIYMFAKKKAHPYVLVQLGLCLLCLVNILICPGNAARVILETETWFPEFASFTFLQKAQLGISAGLSTVFLKENWLFTILSFIVFVLVWNKKGSTLLRLIAAVPLGANIILFALRSLANQGYAMIDKLFSSVTAYGIINFTAAPSIKAYILFFGMLFVLCALLISIYSLFGNSIKSLVCIGLLAVGFATRVLIGFSPTVWASSERTATFLMFSIVACIAYLFNEWPHKNKTATQIMLIIFIALGIYGSAANFLSIL